MAQPEQSVDKDQLSKYREFWCDEMKAAKLYSAIAETCEGERHEIFLALAETERRHAGHWARLLEEHGVTSLQEPGLSFRERMLVLMARRLGVESVIPILLRGEAADADKYDNFADALPNMAAQEKAHGRVLSGIAGPSEGVSEEIVRAEGRHRTASGGMLRAAVFGVNDGLVSNLALVMGMAAGTDGGNIVLLAGVAGLVGGAFSMAAGEWVSVRSQRELYERELAVEAAELQAFPEEERDELVLIYRAKGIPPEEAEALANQIMERPETALDTLAREELGLDPGDLGSAWVASTSSFASFATGALVPVLPYIVFEGGTALALAASLSAVALFGAGALTSIFTGRSAGRAGGRMLAVAAVAAGVTFLVGELVGVAIG